MKPTRSPRSERGVTLVVGLIMLVVVTLMVTSAFLLSTTNLKAVANTQFRDEAIAAGNVAVERVLSAMFVGTNTVPAAGTYNINLNNDDDPNTDYQVSIPTPVCVRAAAELPTGASAPGSGSSVTLVLPPAAPTTFETLWEIFATVTDAASGASVVVRQGVRVRLTEAQKVALGNACP
jgi:hypothetical protein